MGKKWKRDVAIDAAGTYLVVTTPSGGNPSGRNDPAKSVTVKPGDKPAEIEYKAGAGVKLTGVAWKDAAGNPISAPPHGFSASPPTGNGEKMSVNDNDSSTTDSAYYHVVGTVGGVAKQTQDPQIHNSA